MYTLIKNEFQKSNMVSWEDVIIKTCEEHKYNTLTALYDETTLPTFICFSEYYPGTIGEVRDYVNKKYDLPTLHIYCSIGEKSVTYGRHQDPVDVCIVQSYGTITYELDKGTPFEVGDIETVTLEPGDVLWIYKGTWHNPIATEPRITLSFSK